MILMTNLFNQILITLKNLVKIVIMEYMEFQL